MSRRWAPQTRYTLRRNTASIRKGLALVYDYLHFPIQLCDMQLCMTPAYSHLSEKFKHKTLDTQFSKFLSKIIFINEDKQKVQILMVTIQARYLISVG